MIEETIKYNSYLLTEEMIKRRALEIYHRDIFSLDSYPEINRMKVELDHKLRLLAIKELEEEQYDRTKQHISW